MAGITGIGSGTLNYDYGKIASGNRINSAADDASGLAIAQKLQKEQNGLTQGNDNASEGISALNIADGALSQVTDSLQRIYELSVKSANTFMYGNEERSYMQEEANQLLSGIADMVSATNYNGQNLLDNGNSIHIASNPDGSGADISMVNASLKSLGLENFNITSGDAISKVSNAMKMVSGGRVQMGAASIGLQYTKNYNAASAENIMSAKSSLADLDIPKAVSEKKKNELLQNYQLMMLKKKQEQNQINTLGLFS